MNENARGWDEIITEADKRIWAGKAIYDEVVAYAENLGYSVQHNKSADLLTFDKDGNRLMLIGESHVLDKEAFDLTNGRGFDNFAICTAELAQTFAYPDEKSDHFGTFPSISGEHATLLKILLEDLSDIHKLGAFVPAESLASLVFFGAITELPQEELQRTFLQLCRTIFFDDSGTAVMFLALARALAEAMKSEQA